MQDPEHPQGCQVSWVPPAPHPEAQAGCQGRAGLCLPLQRGGFSAGSRSWVCTTGSQTGPRSGQGEETRNEERSCAHATHPRFHRQGFLNSCADTLVCLPWLGNEQLSLLLTLWEAPHDPESLGFVRPRDEFWPLGWLCVKVRFFPAKINSSGNGNFSLGSEDATAGGRVGWLLWFSGSFKRPDLAFASPLTVQHSLGPQSQDSITVPGMGMTLSGLYQVKNNQHFFNSQLQGAANPKDAAVLDLT